MTDNKDPFKDKIPTKFLDPCADYANRSMKCLDKNDYDKSKCSEAFQAYRDCKKVWMDQRRADRRAGRI